MIIGALIGAVVAVLLIIMAASAARDAGAELSEGSAVMTLIVCVILGALAGAVL